MTAFDGISALPALPPEVFEIREKIKLRGCVVAETARRCYTDEIINSALDAFTPEVVRMPPIQSIGPYPKICIC